MRNSILLTSVLSACAPTLQRYEFNQGHMGSSCRVVLYAADAEKADEAAHAAFSELAAVDAKMSDYKPDSELNRLHDGDQPVSPELFEVLQAAQHFSTLSEGAFDITVGPIVRLWRDARKTKRLPDAGELQAALEKVGYKSLKLDPERRTARLEKPGMKLDVGGIAKGYACERAMSALRDRGIRSALVQAGGDTLLSDPPPGKDAWRIRIEGDRIMLVSRCAVSTSGDTERFADIDGRRYSHIVDPKTGIGIERMEMVTVCAPDAVTSDALSTAISVLGPDRGLKLAESLSVQVRIRIREDRGTRFVQTPGFEALLVP
jgi:thiamine biosynthesis lipoprotein